MTGVRDQDERRWTILACRECGAAVDGEETELQRDLSLRHVFQGVVIGEPCGGVVDRLVVVPESLLVRERQARQAAEKKATAAKSFAQWLVALDEPDSTERRTVTLTQIIDQARSVLGVVSPEGEERRRTE